MRKSASSAIPRETTRKHLRVLRDHGVNRLSFGVQDLNEKVQHAVNRIEPESMIRALLKQARELEYDSVSLDLIYGLPHQCTRSFHQTLERIVELRPDGSPCSTSPTCRQDFTSTRTGCRCPTQPPHEAEHF